MSRNVARRLWVIGVAVALVVSTITVFVATSSPVGAAIDAGKLGARYDQAKASVTFRVYSSSATRIEVSVYDTPSDAQELASFALAKDAATNVWSATVATSDLPPTIYYGYRAWGPNWPHSPEWTKGSAAGFVSDVDAAGNRFNPNKLLLDPYAREISHDPMTAAHPEESAYASGPNFRTIDTGPRAPKGIVLDVSGTTGTKPERALKDDIVYEVHARGLTMNDPSVPAEYRGTYRGAAMQARRLAELGVTAVEFLPVQETQNDTNDVNPTGTAGDNYWGYMTLNYFAPDRRYAHNKAPGGPTAEYQEMVRAFHDAGIKVFIDVVYNHTGEGGVYPTDASAYNIFSFRGLDNPTYYSLTNDRQASFDNTGVGGNYNTYHPVAQNLIIDSLAYWRDTLGIDGFRFDLASVLGNTCQHGCFRYSNTDQGTALRRITAELPPRPAAGGSGSDFIAEPWAIGDGTYQVGNFPPGWSEWNGSYRDTVRRDQNKLTIDNVTPGQLATRFAGSSDLYGDDGRRPWHSVNFVVAHDGFTLRDLYGCNGKNNGQAWPYGPSDGGSDDNISWDQGSVATDQRKAARNGMALLMLSAGTPMMTGGDEFLRGLRCNNNPYNVDSDANWLNYSLTGDQSNFHAFTKGLLAFRNAHPALRPVNFYSAADGDGDGLGQLSWFTPAGSAPDAAYWENPNNHAIAWRADGTELGDSASALYTAYNGWSGDVGFVLPSAGDGKRWYRVTDTRTSAEGPDQVARPGAEPLVGDAGTVVTLTGRSVLVLIAK
jgi:isoamylase